MTEKKMKDCGGSAFSKANDVADSIEPMAVEGDCEELARIDTVAIHPDEVDFLLTFGNERVRNKVRQLARQHNLPIDLI